MRPTSLLFALTLTALSALCFAGPAAYAAPAPTSHLEWTLLEDEAPWSARAGLQVLLHRNRFYLMGGRTPRPPSFPPIPGDSDIWGDVWTSDDRGETWQRILETDDESHWPARAYFQALKKGAYMYVLGGQNFEVEPNPDCVPPFEDCAPFISTSEFFNDVWRSRDGIRWHRMTANAPWEGRAGLSAVVHRGAIYVLAGSFNDDPAVIGGPPTRVYFNDVWKSYDGQRWHRMTDDAPWTPRAGAIVVSKGPYMYLLGGEDGFLCEPFPGCELPYYNDVWRSRDGAHWELVTDAAGWSPRPGHQCVVVRNRIVCFGGFGLPVNPIDMWISRTGADWRQLDASPWNATTPQEIKYDFDALVVPGSQRGAGIYTFGGDRETFDFMDPLNYLNVDNDVWRFGPGRPGTVAGELFDADAPDGATAPVEALGEATASAAGPRAAGRLEVSTSPNPFRSTTKLEYVLTRPAEVEVAIYDASGRRVRDLASGVQEAGKRRISWNATDAANRRVAAGVYFAKIDAAGESRLVRLVLLK